MIDHAGITVTDREKPAAGPHCRPRWCGAFTLQPDGNSVEAMCHHPLGEQHP